MNKLTLKLIAIRELLKDEQGQDLVEYALLIAFVAAVGAAALPGFATAIEGAFTKAGDALTNPPIG